MIASFGRFTLKDTPDVGPCWCPPAGVSALIDLVPPGQDADPDVNFALMLSDSPLDSEDAHYSFGSGNVTEMNLTGADRDAWQAVTGFRPTAGTIAEALAEHLLTGSDPTGLDYTRPLTAGANRRLDVYLGGAVWSHTLADWTDPLALPVMRVEAEALAGIYREQGETQYRLAMGGLHRKYNFYGPVKGLIAWLFPSGRDDLPLMDELEPQTVITELFPSTGAITSGQNNTWSIVSGSFDIPVAGSVQSAATVTESRALLGYTFGGNDMIAQFAIGTGDGNGFNGTFVRANASLNTAYLLPYKRASNWAVFKFVSGTATQLGSNFGTCTTGDTAYGSVIGATLITKDSGVQIDSRTDTAVATGNRVGLYLYRSTSSAQYLTQPLTFDDTISGGGGVVIPIFMNQYRQRRL